MVFICVYLCLLPWKLSVWIPEEVQLHPLDVDFAGWTGRPGVLRFMGSQRVGHNWATELNWTELNWTELNWGIIRHLHRRPRMRLMNHMSSTFSNTYLELRSLFQHFSLKVNNSLCNKEWWKNLKLEIQWHSYYFLIMLPRESYLTSPCLNFLSVERGW